MRARKWPKTNLFTLMVLKYYIILIWFVYIAIVPTRKAERTSTQCTVKGYTDYNVVLKIIKYWLAYDDDENRAERSPQVVRLY